MVGEFGIRPNRLVLFKKACWIRTIVKYFSFYIPFWLPNLNNSYMVHPQSCVVSGGDCASYYSLVTLNYSALPSNSSSKESANASFERLHMTRQELESHIHKFIDFPTGPSKDFSHDKLFFSSGLLRDALIQTV